MKKLKINATNITPEVNFDLAGDFLIKGISIPEKATEFYRDIFSWIEVNRVFFPKKITINLNIEYMNTPSKKFIILLLGKVIETRSNEIDVSVIWNYDHEVEDLKEEGEMLEEVLEFPFIFKPY